MADESAFCELTGPTLGTSEPDRMWTLTNVGESGPRWRRRAAVDCGSWLS
jgi:hypothetical protein